MIEQFNRILQKFGGHRVRLVPGYRGGFEIAGWGVFKFLPSGAIVERTQVNEFVSTANSMWLYSVSLGNTRNDLGEVPT